MTLFANLKYFGMEEESEEHTKRICELLEMLKETGSQITFIAGPISTADTSGELGSPAVEIGHGTIFIRTPCEITLRSRAVLSMAFPHTVPVEVTEEDMGMDKNCLPDSNFFDDMKRVLSILMRFKGHKTAANDIEAPKKIIFNPDVYGVHAYGEADAPRVTTIDALDLSARARNCLKRAGISSIEELSRK